MPQYSLILHPAGPGLAHVPVERIAAGMESLGLVGDAIAQYDYLAGNRFLELITFMGCSPNIRLEPEEDGNTFTLIRFLSDEGAMMCMFSNALRPPKCPQCRKPIPHWHAASGTTGTNCTESTTCEHCDTAWLPWELDWQRQAGFGHCLIEITDVYPKEAIPLPELLDRLKEITGLQWSYFYMQY